MFTVLQSDGTLVDVEHTNTHRIRCVYLRNFLLEETDEFLFTVSRKLHPLMMDVWKHTCFPQVVTWNALGKGQCLSQNELKFIGSIFSIEVLTEKFANTWICGLTI